MKISSSLGAWQQINKVENKKRSREFQISKSRNLFLVAFNTLRTSITQF